METEALAVLREVESLYRSLRGGDRDLRPGDRLLEDLAIDSLAAVELLVGLEERYDVELLSDPRLEAVATVGELLALLEDARTGAGRA